MITIVQNIGIKAENTEFYNAKFHRSDSVNHLDLKFSNLEKKKG